MYVPSTRKKRLPAADPSCCAADDCGASLRNNYFSGKPLTIDSYRVEQRYQVERRRLLNRAVHGWGVVYGYEIPEIKVVESPATHVTIGAGFALDEYGRELWQTQETRIAVSDLLARDKNGKPREWTRLPCDEEGRPRECWVLRAHYAERDVGPVTVTDRCRCEHDEWNYTCETVRYSLTCVECKDCCAEPACGLDCKCDRCCSGTVTVDRASTADAPKRARRGGDCLCKQLTCLDVPTDCPELSVIDEDCGGRARVDFRHGVPLACLVLTESGECKTPRVVALDPCCSRRLVKRNDLLFDLIQGCDVTRIDAIGWAAFHRKEVAFADFVAAVENDRAGKEPFFWVKFSRPVRVDSVTAEAFAMTLLGKGNGGWWETWRAPIVRVQTDVGPPEPKDPHGHTRYAQIIFDPEWDVRHAPGRCRIEEGRIELEVRGDLIVDCNGQTVDANTFDANTVGDQLAPSGNGTPGGTFRSTFRLTPHRPDEARRQPS